MVQNRMMNAYLARLVKDAVSEMGAKIEEMGRPTKTELVDVALRYHLAGQTKEGLEIVLGKELGEEDDVLLKFFRSVQVYAIFTGKSPRNPDCYNAVYGVHFNED